jgi:hypothetical protein
VPCVLTSRHVLDLLVTACQGVKETLYLLESVVSRSAQALLDEGGALLVARLFKCSKSKLIIAVSIRVFEKLVRLPGGPEAFMASGVLEVCSHPTFCFHSSRNRCRAPVPLPARSCVCVWK